MTGKQGGGKHTLEVLSTICQMLSLQSQRSETPLEKPTLFPPQKKAWGGALRDDTKNGCKQTNINIEMIQDGDDINTNRAVH